MILFLTNELNLQKGGQELANKYFLEILKEKYKVFIFNQKFFPEGNHYGHIKCDLEVDFLRLGFIKGLKDLVVKLKQINKEYNFEKVIISATPFSTLLFFSFIKSFKLFKKSKFIHWCHIDPFSSIFQASRIPFILYPLGFFLYRKFDYLVVTNPYMEDTFKKKYFVSKDKIRLITCPLRPDFNKLIKEKVKFDFSRPVIVTVTRLTTIQKDPVTLLKAFKIVKEKYPKATLLFLGDGPEKEKLKKIAKDFGIDKNTIFIGFVKNPLAYVKRSDVFVLSSKSEGTPVVLIEAQACGVPIIATDCPVGPRWILDNGKNGVLVKIGDYHNLANKIILLIQNKKLIDLLVLRGLRFNKKFLINKFRKYWFNLLDSN